ncbi:hypothetical protein [Kribbella sp. NPDC051620]|uniref:hypothetical protein n=1 Tax=Kribbella sp. NPDC051620 TaxID=3364120 RepID=UPI00379530C1
MNRNTPGLEEMIAALAQFDATAETWRSQVEIILDGLTDPRELIKSHMRGWSAPERADMEWRSHVTATHYKWLLHRDPAGFTLWLHDYKPSDERGFGYAEVPHNHRYDLCSRVLRGGFTNQEHDVSEEVAYLRSKNSLAVGDLLSLDHETVHSLADILPGTKTLLVEGPRKRTWSTSYPVGGSSRRHVDFEGRFDGLQESL